MTPGTTSIVLAVWATATAGVGALIRLVLMQRRETADVVAVWADNYASLLAIVHDLQEGQARCDRRVGQLERALRAAGVPVPHEG